MRIYLLRVDSLQNKFEDFSENWLHSASNMSLTVPSGNFPTTTTTSPVRQVIQLPPLLEQHIGYLTDQVPLACSVCSASAHICRSTTI